MIVKRRQEADANLAQALQVGIGDVPGRAIVFDEILIVLVVGRCVLGKWAQVVGCPGVGLERT